MSTAIVIRRYKCWDAQDLNQSWIHQGSIQVSGLHERQFEVLSDQLSGFKYKIICNCKYCLCYKEEFKVAAHNLNCEPVVKGMSVVFNVLTQLGYRIESTSVTQNADGSSSTTWILLKPPVSTDI